MKKDQRQKLTLLQQGLTPEQGQYLNFLRWFHRRRPRRSLARRQASQSGVEMWSRLPKTQTQEKKMRNGKQRMRRTWIQPGPGSGMI